MVAWHEVPGIRKRKEPVPEGRCDYVFARQSTKIVWHVLGSVMESTAAPTQSSCPSGTKKKAQETPAAICVLARLQRRSGSE